MKEVRTVRVNEIFIFSDQFSVINISTNVSFTSIKSVEILTGHFFCYQHYTG